MTIKHIYWFAPYHLACPSTRYRGVYPLEFLHQNYNLTYDFFYPNRSLKGISQFMFLFFQCLFFRKKESVIVIQKVVTNKFYANLLKILVFFQKEKTIYDLDDAEYLRHPPKVLNYFIQHCQYVTVGSQALKDYSITMNENVTILTSPVIKHSSKKKQKNKLFTIGWVGDFGNGHKVSQSFSHKKNLYDLFFPALLEINFPVVFTVFGVKRPSDKKAIQNYFQSKPNVQLQIPMDLNWKNDKWLYDEISKFDIGVSPMINHPFNQAKSAFKAKQYLSCGIPVLASGIGENDLFISNKYNNGLICSTSENFRCGIVKFYRMNKSQYQLYSQNALNSRFPFSIEQFCKDWLNILS